MNVDKFIAYHPYLTFSDMDVTSFVDLRGKFGQDVFNNPDLESLWLLARGAYRELPVAASQSDFDEVVKGFIAFTNGLRPIIKMMVESGRIGMTSSTRKTKPDISWIDGSTPFQIIKLGWSLSEHVMKTGDSLEPGQELEKIYAEAFLMACLYETDSALVGIELDGRAAICSALDAAEAFSLAMAITSKDLRLQQARKLNARQGALAKIALSKKTIAKDGVRAWWIKWQESPDLYKNKRAFADAMRDKYPDLENEESIKRWTRQWGQDKHDRGTLPMT